MCAVITLLHTHYMSVALLIGCRMCDSVQKCALNVHIVQVFYMRCMSVHQIYLSISVCFYNMRIDLWLNTVCTCALVWCLCVSASESHFECPWVCMYIRTHVLCLWYVLANVRRSSWEKALLCWPLASLLPLCTGSAVWSVCCLSAWPLLMLFRFHFCSDLCTPCSIGGGNVIRQPCGLESLLC